MKSTGIVRRIDDLGRVVIPKEIRRNLKIKEGDPLEIITNYNNEEIIIRPYYKSWEECVIDWYDSHFALMKNSTISFIHSVDYTICTLWDAQRHKYYVGQAKRYVSDIYNDRIGKVAAYARAIGQPINEMIGYKGR